MLHALNPLFFVFVVVAHLLLLLMVKLTICSFIQTYHSLWAAVYFSSILCRVLVVYPPPKNFSHLLLCRVASVCPSITRTYSLDTSCLWIWYIALLFTIIIISFINTQPLLLTIWIILLFFFIETYYFISFHLFTKVDGRLRAVLYTADDDDGDRVE